MLKIGRLSVWMDITMSQSYFLISRYLEPPQQNTKPSEFPLLVVESVHSKPVKNSIIAENEEVQQLVEKCLKARGKWQVDETMEEVNPCLKSNSLFYSWKR